MQQPPEDFGGRWRNPTAPSFHSASGGSSGGGGLRSLGFGCGAFSLAAVLGGGLTLVLLVTRVLKRTFHLRHKTADMIGFSSLAIVGIGVVGLVVSIVLIATGRKRD